MPVLYFASFIGMAVDLVAIAQGEIDACPFVGGVAVLVFIGGVVGLGLGGLELFAVLL